MSPYQKYFLISRLDWRHVCMKKKHISFINSLIAGIVANHLAQPTIETLYIILILTIFVLLNSKKD